MFQKQPRKISRRITKEDIGQKDIIEVKKTTWQEYLKLVPLLYALIIIISFGKLHIFYQFFKINISEFLELSEILTLFLDEIVTYIGIFSFQFVIVLGMWSPSKSSENQTEKGKIETAKIFKKQRRVVIIIFVIIIASFVAEETYALVSSYLEDNTKFIIRLVNSIMLLSCIGLSWIFGGKSGRRLVKSRYFRAVVFFFSLLIIFTIADATSTAIRVRAYSKPYFVEIEYNDKIIQSDSTQFFIGKSNNYIFYYNKEEQRTKAFPMKDVGYIK